MVDFSMMVGMTMVIAQFWKKLGLKTELVPILNLLTGLVLSLIWFHDTDFWFWLQQGFTIGLASSGLYDVGVCLNEF